jgi:hypothetical protein
VDIFGKIYLSEKLKSNNNNKILSTNKIYLKVIATATLDPIDRLYHVDDMEAFKRISVDHTSLGPTKSLDTDIKYDDIVKLPSIEPISSTDSSLPTKKRKWTLSEIKKGSARINISSLHAYLTLVKWLHVRVNHAPLELLKWMVNKNVVLIKGWFNETLPSFIKEQNKKISFIHMDADLYSSTKYIFDTLKDYIDKDCVIVFDELVNYPNFDGPNGELRAFYEFITENKVDYKWIGINGCGGQEVAVMIHSIDMI